MGVIKRGNSKYWYIQFQHNGKTFIKSSKTTDRKLAEIMEADWRKRLILNEVVGIKDRIDFDDILKGFADSKRELASHGHILLMCRHLRTHFKSVRYFERDHHVRSRTSPSGTATTRLQQPVNQAFDRRHSWGLEIRQKDGVSGQ